MTADPILSFAQLDLDPRLLDVLGTLGYETPSPIQAQCIPLLASGRDLVGQAQTGTGKTAAFALPVLQRLDLNGKDPQVLVLVPTRELALQVAEAFQKYASHLAGFHVLPVYGGQEYGAQIRALKRGVHVVVGTPGRVMDHMRKGTLNLASLKILVLDEADEMLRMGFIDDVEWVLQQTPSERQVALFSATMPKQIRHIASQYLKEPAEVTIRVKTTTAETIRQRYWPVSGVNKLDALTRILEAEPFEAMLVFVRTRIVTIELAEKLAARGFSAVALNGDIPQAQRERTIENLKKGKLDILVATDVAARGLDVDRISHVVNYDIPYDTEAYVHRIGRTGRAGRAGDAILFVAPREMRMLGAIERATRQKIELMELPSTELINQRRSEAFMQRITEALQSEGLDTFVDLVEAYQQTHPVSPIQLAAALAKLVQGDSPFLLPVSATPSRSRKAEHRSGNRAESDSAPAPHRSPAATPHPRANRPAFAEDDAPQRPRAPRPPRPAGPPEPGMERYRLEVGQVHQVQPGNIVGAIANEAGLDSKHIGRITIHEDHSTVDLPEGMPAEVFAHLQKVRVAGQPLRLSRLGETPFRPGPGLPGKRPRPDRKPTGPRPPVAADRPVRRKAKSPRGKP